MWHRSLIVSWTQIFPLRDFRGSCVSCTSPSWYATGDRTMSSESPCMKAAGRQLLLRFHLPSTYVLFCSCSVMTSTCEVNGTKRESDSTIIIIIIIVFLLLLFLLFLFLLFLLSLVTGLLSWYFSFWNNNNATAQASIFTMAWGVLVLRMEGRPPIWPCKWNMIIYTVAKMLILVQPNRWKLCSYFH